MLTSAWTPLRPHPLQVAMWKSRARFVAAACGRGSGKSTIARRYVCRWLNVKRDWPDPKYFYALPTMDQARLKHWEPFKNLIPQHWIVKKDEVRMTIKTIYGSTLYLLGLDKAQRAEGDQFDGGVIDESCDVRPHVFKRTFLPTLTHRRGWCWRIGVPKINGVGAREFRNCCDEWLAKMLDGDPNYASYSWPSGDILSPEELAVHAGAMDPKTFNEQYNASWETASGLVYYAFDRENIRDWRYDPSLPLIVGSDFNVSPMAWVIAQMHGKEINVFDEIWMKDTNTSKTLDELFRRYASHNAGWYFFGDASSKSRKTSAVDTDFLQIKNDLRFKNSKLFYPPANPGVANRVSTVNWAFKAANGTRSLFIDKKCLHLVKDLEYLAYREETREIDLRDRTAGHITDALGYAVVVLKPMTIETPNAAPRVFIQGV